MAWHWHWHGGWQGLHGWRVCRSLRRRDGIIKRRSGLRMAAWQWQWQVWGNGEKVMVWEENSLAKRPENIRGGGLTNLPDGFKADRVPHLFGYSGKESLINLGDVETLSSCDVIVPLAPNLGLIRD